MLGDDFLSFIKLIKLDESSTEKQVREAAKALNIQVDNLCQFLPQDRVSAFANMNPQELLKETERAAGGSELIQQHEQLIKVRGSEKRLLQVCFFSKHKT